MAAFDSPSARPDSHWPCGNCFQRAAQRLRGVSGIQQRQGDRPAEEWADVKVLNLHLHRDLRESERDGETVRERQQQLEEPK